MTISTVCAWCGRSRARAGADGPVTHGICAECAAKLGVFPVENLYDLSESDLDRLPVGAVALDASGRVTSYNIAEQQMSGRTRQQVLGRNFFTEVAPCTNVRELAGRWREMATAAVDDRAEAEFVFRFDQGARLVTLRMVWEARAQRGFLLVGLLD